ncbi:MAG: YvcK family protein [Candidatus Pacebacteria bacterium]|nr:YvcK family protein [Candidatus Paceibacterota bacterium]
MKLKKIVCFGGGSVVPKAVLTPFREYPAEITSITSMTDDGGSTGALRRELGVPAPGDIRRHILAFSDAPAWKKNLWGMRFGSEEFEGGHKGHNFGNVFIAGLCQSLKSYDEVLKECCIFLEVGKKYQALPATLGNITLCAELENGQVIKGESEIDVPKMHDADLKIKKLLLKPQAKVYKPAQLAIAKADALVFGPGDLYSSLLPCFLPRGMKKAIADSSAKKILVTNVMNKHGETNGFGVSDFVREVEKYIGTKLDYVLYNKYIPDEESARKAQEEDESILAPVVFDGDPEEPKFVGVDYLLAGSVNNDPKKTGAAIWKLING